MSGGGPSGENSLTVNDGLYHDLPDWQSCGAWFWAVGAEEGKPSAPVPRGSYHINSASITDGLYDTSEVEIFADYHFDTSAWDQFYPYFYYPLLSRNISGELNGGNFFIEADNDEADTGSGFALYVSFGTWTGGLSGYVNLAGDGLVPWLDANWRIFPRSEFENIWRRIKIHWKGVTIVGAWTDVLADGFFKLYIDDELVFDLTGLALYSNGMGFPRSYEVLHHQARDIAVGYYGLFGATTNLTIQTPEEEAPDEVTFANAELTTGLAWLELTRPSDMA